MLALNRLERLNIYEHFFLAVPYSNDLGKLYSLPQINIPGSRVTLASCTCYFK